MKQTRLLRIVSFILALIMVLELGPIQAYATDMEYVEDTRTIPMPEITAPAPVDEIPQVYIEGEVSELRSEYEKHYRLTDGSYMAVQYPVSVHYEEDGQWVDIDNTLQVATMFSGETVYQAVNGDSIQAFAAYLTDGPIMTMAQGERILAMSIWTGEAADEDSDAEDSSEDAIDDSTDNAPVATEDPISDKVTDDESDETTDSVTEDSSKDSTENTEEDTTGENSEDTTGDSSDGANDGTSVTVSEDLSEDVSDDADDSEYSSDTSDNDESAETAPENDLSGIFGLASDVTDETNDHDDSDERVIVAHVLTNEGAAPAHIDEEAETLWELDDVMPDALSASILYEDVFPGVDLRYDTFSYNVKESIILKQQMDLDEYVYSFLLTLDGLDPVLQDDGSVDLLDENSEIKFTIPAPYMWDANDVYSDAVYYELEEIDEGWILSVYADEEWLEDDDRSYPVIIDPSYNVPVSNLDYAVAAEKKTPSSSSIIASPGYFSCGYSQDFGELEGYARVKTLPTIPAGSIITEAKLHPVSEEHWSTTYCRMDIRPLTKSLGDYWDSYVPWSKRPAPSEEPAMDFIYLAKGDELSLKPTEWDITPAMMQWYADPSSNYGLRMTAVTNAKEVGNSGWCKFSPTESWLTVTYRNTVGTEDYYTYETQSAVRAGTGYVGDFSSALTVFKTDISYSSATTPFSVGHVFNSSLRGKELDSFDKEKDTFAPDYSKMKTGNGWQLSVQESVRQTTINTIRYLVYRDGDGTLHYFKKSSGNVYVDEDGLGLTIKQDTEGSDVSYMMEDQSGTERYFRNGYLKYIKDTNGNKICFLYNNATYSDTHSTWHPPTSGAYLTSIVAARNKQEPQMICTFQYSNNRLSSITDFAGRVTRYTYDANGNLTKVTHPDNTEAHYTYSSTGHLTGMYDAEAKYGIEYTYDGDGVSNIQEYAKNDAGSKIIGTKLERKKPSIQETEYRYDGNDRQFNTDDDIVNRYAFDYAGRTINAVTLDSGEERILGVSAAAYKASSSEEPAANNRISKTGQSGQNGVNLLKNSGMEYDNGTSSNPDWRAVASQTGKYVGEISDADARTGQKALKTTIDTSAANNHTNGRVAGMYQLVDLKANTTYTFSAYVNTNGISNFSTGGIYAAFLNSENGILASGTKVTYTTVEDIDEGWQRIYCTYTPKQDINNCRVAVIQEDAYGSVYYDDLQLEVGDVPSTANLLQDATFNIQTSYWSGENFSYKNDSGDPHHPNVLSINGEATAYRRVSQRVMIEQVCTDQTFLLSGWGKAASGADCKTSFNWSYGSSINNKHESRYYGLIARAWYKAKDGGEHAEYFFMPFNDDYDGWQFASCVIVPDSYYQKQQMTLKYIDVYVVYDRNFNTMYVDNLSLRQEPCTTYTYNAQGNVVSAGATGSASQAVEYKSDNIRPATVWKSESEVYYYQYYEDNKYLPSYISNALSLVYTKYDYDAYGNVKNTEVGKFNDDGVATSYPKIKTSSTYTSNGSLLESETNGNGQTTTYTYYDTRLVHTVKDAKDTVVTSRYNELNDRNWVSFIDGQVAVEYAYKDGMMSQIARGGYITENGVKSAKQLQLYNLAYDAFGNMTKVSVGGKLNEPSDAYVLATYDYGDTNGHLNSMTYGNGDNITYYYDELDRLTEEMWNEDSAGEHSYQYFYNSEGALSKKVDTATGNAVNYEYDSIGRLIHSSVTTWNAKTEEYETDILTEHMYDRQSRIAEQSYQIRNSDGTYKTYSLKYSYRGSDGALVKVESADGYIDAYSFAYDEIARLSTRKNSFFKQTYKYKTSGGTTTTLVESIDFDPGTYATAFDKFVLSYGYDALGNIETITNSENASDDRTYTYDIQGQLLTEKIGNQTNSYTYDTYGNIRTATENGTTHTYTYGNADWKDLLTAYDNQPITYDASGNPTSYYNGTRWTFGWKNGRQLSSASGGGQTISYTYDMAGIRNSKTVNDITYHYDTLDGKVVRQTWTENGIEHVFDIIYDASGLPYSCVYDGNRYYYVLNQQGDVIRIVGYLGATLCEYQYDAWGNVIDISGPYDYSIGRINPIRYRGYYYDTETGFYYLQSRYYDPSIGRFINADAATYIGASTTFSSYNLFTYCLNDPVNNTDDGGTFTFSNWAKVGIGVAIIAAAAAITVATGGAAAGTLVAAVNCAAHGALVGAVTQGATGAITGAISGAVTHRLATGSWDGAAQAAANGAATGFLEGTISGAISGAINSPYCFVAGTLVLTVAGTVAIETIQTGDMVWAWDEETGEVAPKEVVETYVNETYELIHVFVDGEEIVTTPSHPFYSPVKGWTNAVHLRAGDILVLVNGEYVIVEKIQHEILETPITVYNFEVEEYHTYFVSDEGILVHNDCTVEGGPHGNDVHKGRIRDKIKELVQSGDYSKVYGNCKLKTAGLIGDQKPDIIAIGKNGVIEVWEYASKSQATGTRGYELLKAKVKIMSDANPGVNFHDIIPW